MVNGQILSVDAAGSVSRARLLKTVSVIFASRGGARMAKCDLCEILFPHAEPNEAVYDGRLGGDPSRVWAYACEAHKSYLKERIKCDS